jgi:N-acetylmuramoyl-L-alanine amidase
MKILIDNGHGEDTPGKRSPDGRLREYAYTREIADMVVSKFKGSGLDAERIVTENNDVPLSERCKRVNNECKKLGTANVILISIHCNAAGSNGQWMNARGWEAYTCLGQTKSDVLAEHLYKAAKENLLGMKLRTDILDKDSDKESDFYILKNTKCPAVLTENLFQDNREDVDFLLSQKGKESITKLHVDGIISFLKS